jgi:hypothetical protein
MLWKHEEPLEEEAADGPAPVPANPLVNGSHEAGEAPAICIFRSPSPVESNHHQVSGALNSSQQGLPADIDQPDWRIATLSALLYVEFASP